MTVGGPVKTCLPNQTLVKGECIDILNNSCSWYQQPYKSQTCGFNPLCWIGIMKPKTKEGCETNGWVYAAIAGVTVLIIIIAYMLINKKPNKKTLRRGKRR